MGLLSGRAGWAFGIVIAALAATILVLLTSCGPEAAAPGPRRIDQLEPTRVLERDAGGHAERVADAYEPTPTPTATPTPRPVSPTPTATPRPVEVRPRDAGSVLGASYDGGGASIPALIAAYPWPFAEALAVARCESTLNPGAYNPSGAQGLYQVMPTYHGWRLGPGESLFDPAVNVRVAYEIWADSGWRQWSCRP